MPAISPPLCYLRFIDAIDLFDTIYAIFETSVSSAIAGHFVVFTCYFSLLLCSFSRFYVAF